MCLILICQSPESEKEVSLISFHLSSSYAKLLLYSCSLIFCFFNVFSLMFFQIVGWAVQAFFKYDTQSASALPQSQTVPASGVKVTDVTTNVSDSSFLFGGPAPAGSAHGSYLASPLPRRYLIIFNIKH